MFQRSSRRLSHIQAAIVLGALLGLSSAYALDLTPNQNRGGVLPDGQAEITFTLSNGNWTELVTLPASAPDKARVTIKSSAAYDTTVSALYSVLAVPVKIKSGDALQFVFDAVRAIWLPSGTGGPRALGASLQPVNQALLAYTVTNEDWAEVITLPATSKDGALVFIGTDADKATRVSTTNVHFASTLNLQRGQNIVMRFEGKIKKWFAIQASPFNVIVRNGASDVMAVPTTFRTRVELLNGRWQKQIVLPPSANDRDRITVTSNAAWSSEITGASAEFTGSMSLLRGDAYEFMYEKGRGKWVILSAPTRQVQAASLASQPLGNPSAPVTVVNVDASSKVALIALPNGGKAGDRIVVRSAATTDTSVRLSNAASDTVQGGEEVVYLRTAEGTWKRETLTITLLQLYSDDAVTKYGAEGVKAHQQTALRMTNEALANSGATFRFKSVGMLRFNVSTDKKLNEALGFINSSADARALRDQYKADILYYTGKHEGCGVAYMPGYVATESTYCGNTVMRHELGHNMGLPHITDESEPQPHATGTAMEGNSRPFFATPNRFDSVTGLPFAVTKDSVKSMNDRAKTTAAYR